ncbi:pyridoxamine 5'-phosphate oxidase family protein [Tepidiforma sp.]|uniref:pyridoxamine 5'-phosphate oxidase family protein n=1 Tax=Tepidiforma sp. TaxID=2682230 RepID=UPI002ADD8A91|nr:pyridoxamine 5'-phosphate oxidase family protein [Tepidiforma sp.]
MPPLRYHAGQRSIQEEAKTTHVAEKLAHWVGPVAEFAHDADLILLATLVEAETLRFSVLSGAPPLVEVVDGPDVRLRFPAAISDRLPLGRCGGLAISMARARRARLNGVMARQGSTNELTASETFTLCRKYIAPSLSLGEPPQLGPESRHRIALDDPWLTDLLARAETSFLASISPDGGPDVAHRGGPAGFLTLNPATGVLSWPEYVGDGIFKSAGNVRATGKFTLLVPDLESGDGVELVGAGKYTNTRPERKLRLDPLVQHREPFPMQGFIEGHVSDVFRLQRVLRPRRRIEKALRITSCSAVGEQAPQ